MRYQGLNVRTLATFHVPSRSHAPSCVSIVSWTALHIPPLEFCLNGVRSDHHFFSCSLNTVFWKPSRQPAEGHGRPPSVLEETHAPEQERPQGSPHQPAVSARRGEEK